MLDAQTKTASSHTLALLLQILPLVCNIALSDVGLISTIYALQHDPTVRLPRQRQHRRLYMPLHPQQEVLFNAAMAWHVRAGIAHSATLQTTLYTSPRLPTSRVGLVLLVLARRVRSSTRQTVFCLASSTKAFRPAQRRRTTRVLYSTSRPRVMEGLIWRRS